MKRTSSEKPYLSWCLIVRNCEKTLPGVLEQCLQSLRKISPEAEIVIVDTMSSDETPDIAKKYADVFAEYRGPRGDWTREMLAFDDAAAARNESFRLASGRWKAWADADDIVLWEQDAKKLLALNGKWHPPAKAALETAAVDGQPMSLEDTLKLLERDRPEIKVLYAPYLYQSDENGLAKSWQDRERIMRDDSKHVWRSPGHEVCVPDRPEDTTQPGYLSALLYWHRKKFVTEDFTFSAKRHWDALIGGYTSGVDRGTRTCLYLANFASALCPDRVEEFLNAAYENATIPLDRYRVLMEVAKVRAHVEHKIADAYEAIHAAIGIYPNVPDAYLRGGQIASAIEDWDKAAAWFEAASKCEVGAWSDPDVTPRTVALAAPTMAAHARWRLAKVYEGAGDWLQTLACLQKARDLQLSVLNAKVDLGPDLREAASLYAYYSNEAAALEQTFALRNLLDHLLRNDESAKALLLTECIPHQLDGSTFAKVLRDRVASVKTHMDDPIAYAAFYDDDKVTGAVAPSKDKVLRNGIEGQDWRVRYAAQRLRNLAVRLGRPIDIVDIGCFDGLTAIPILLYLGDLVRSYTGFDTQQGHVDRFLLRVNEWPECEKLRGKVFTVKGGVEEARSAVEETDGDSPRFWDAVLALEVIEHVPDPATFLMDLVGLTSLQGEVVLSTPWGAYDKGQVPETTSYGTPRDPRGHLWALTPRDLATAAREWMPWGVRVEDLHIEPAVGGHGGSFCVAVRKVADANTRLKGGFPRKDITFYVPAALWAWNASHVYETGIGASEETIVFLARELARLPGTVSVYGPLPINNTIVQEEVVDGVAYWPNDRYWEARGRGKLVVSRQPSLGLALEEQLGDNKVTPKVLWLQDAIYPDLNARVAEHYERIVVVSEWHKRAMHERHGVPLEKMDVAYNFLLTEHFKVADPPKRERHRFFWGSSPDRGLLNILEMWPRILAEWPDATLHVYYGWDGMKKLAAINPSIGPSFRRMWARWTELKKQKGVIDHGRVNHAVIAREMMASDVFWYPGSFEETGCLHGDTLISVPGDHRVGLPPRIPIKDLVGKENFPVYALDKEAHKFVIATCKKVWMTKIAPELIGLRLDDGSVLRLTPEHRVMNFDLEWVEAKDLKAGDRLTALHHRYDVYIKGLDGRWDRESRMVGEWMAGRGLGVDEHVDHLDPLRLDNRPEALQILSASVHFSKTHKNKVLRKDQLQKRSEKAAEWVRTHPEEVSKMRAAAQAARTAGMTPEQITAYNRATGLKAWETRRRKYGPTGFKPGTDVDAIAQHARDVRDERRQNHRVVEVFRIPGPIPVYDMEVERVHNFIADGVVVHNCSSASKARAAGCVPVVHPIAALPETAAGGVIYPSRTPDETMEAYAERSIPFLREAFDRTDTERASMSERAIEEYRVETFMPKWKEWLR